MTCFDHRFRGWGQHRILCEACGEVRVVQTDTASRPPRRSGKRPTPRATPHQEELPLDTAAGDLEADVLSLMRQRGSLDAAIEQIADEAIRNVAVDDPSDDTLGAGLGL